MKIGRDDAIVSKQSLRREDREQQDASRRLLLYTYCGAIFNSTDIVICDRSVEILLTIMLSAMANLKVVSSSSIA
jgi:hypothetical protein